MTQNKYHEIKQQIAQFDVVSFSLFDVLIQYPFVENNHLYDFIGNIYDEPEYAIKRISTQRFAENNLIKSEQTFLNLGDIYQYMDKKYQYLQEIEQQLSIKYAKARPEILAIYQQAIKSGKTVIVSCNSPLDMITIEQILAQNDYHDYAKLYHGSQVQEGQETTIYELIKSDYAQQKILHLTTNENDNKLATQHGLSVSSLEQPFKIIGNNDNQQQFINHLNSPEFDDMDNSNPIFSIIYRMLNLYKEQHPEIDLNNIDNDIAIHYYLPLAMYYCFYVKSLINNPENPLQKPWFSTRDCNIMKSMYDVLYPEDNSELFHSSRMLIAKNTPHLIKNMIKLYAGDSNQKNAEKLKLVFGEKHTQWLIDEITQEKQSHYAQEKQLIKQKNKFKLFKKRIPQETFISIADRIYNKINNSEFWDEFFQSDIQQIRKYLEFLQINKPENLIVDIGWSGTIQYGMAAKQSDFLASVAYFLKVNSETSLPNTFSLCSDRELNYGRLHELMSNMESIFTHYTSTVVDYKIDGNKLEPIYLNEPGKEKTIKERSRNTEQTAIHFCQWLIQEPMFKQINDDIVNQSDLQLSDKQSEFIFNSILKYKKILADLYGLIA